MKWPLDDGFSEFFIFFLYSSIGGGSVCDRFELLRHMGSRIPSSGVQVHAGNLRVSIIHWTLTWTTGSLMCVHHHSFFNVCTWSFLCLRRHRGGWAHRQRVSTTFFTRKNSQICAPDGVRTSGHGNYWILRPMLYQLSHPISEFGKWIDLHV